MSTEKSSEKEISLLRLYDALDSVGIKEWGRVTEVIKITGYSNGRASDLLSGKASLNTRFLKSLCAPLGIREEWVMTGEGEMKRGEGAGSSGEGQAVVLSAMDLKIYQQTKDLSEDEKRAVENIIEDYKLLQELKKERKAA